MFMLVKVLEGLVLYGFTLFKVSDFKSSIIQILVILTRYLVFYMCDFTLWYGYRLWFNYNIASS